MLGRFGLAIALLVLPIPCRATESVKPTRFGVWVDFSRGPHDAQLLRRDVVEAGITDVFLQARDSDGRSYYPDPEGGGPVPRQDFAAAVAALRGSGVRVHAWISVNRDPFLATRHPDWAMQDIGGRASPDWISPASPKVVASIVATVRELLERYELDGIHLDELRYPNLDHDFSPRAVQGFRRAAGIGALPLGEMVERHHQAWIQHRAARIAAVVAAVAKTIAERHGGSVTLSATLSADAAISKRVAEEIGQDYAVLAPYFGFIVVRAGIHEAKQGPEWIPNAALAVRRRIGDREMLVGLEAWQRPGVFEYTPASFRALLEAARDGWSGQVFYAYSSLFGRGSAESRMPAGSIEQLTAFRRELNDASRTAARGKRRVTTKRFEPTLFTIVAVVFAALAAIAALGRRP